ncbi:hypothetical protein GYH30_028841 [Glycine max]|nr:hypothetical protein GYH30_028841 [Glycine max]
MDASPSSMKLLKFLLLCLLCTILFNSVMCSSKIHCNEKDMNTLLRFKTGVTDPSGVLSSWFPKLDCCQWTGVKCDNITGRVTHLNLPCHTTQPKIVALDEKDDKSHCLTGEFSLTLLELEFLSYLNFSNNDFKSIQYNSMGGKKCDHLSRGTQLGSTNLSYIGNPHLCGAPLTKICPQDEKSNNTKHAGEEDDDDKSELYSWFYMGLGIGFAVGFLGVLGAIFFNRRCRHAYFRFLHRMYDFVIQKMNSIY